MDDEMTDREIDAADYAREDGLWLAEGPLEDEPDYDEDVEGALREVRAVR
jgi:hypothetical protein